MEETILTIGETVENTMYDMAIKSESFFEKFLSAASKEVLVLLVLTAGLVVYFMINSVKKAKRSINAKKNTLDKRFFQEYAEVELKGILTRMTGENRVFFLKGAQDYLDKKGYKLSKESVREMIFDFMKVKDNDPKMKKMYLKGENADMFLDAIYKSLQLGLKTGPEYEKVQSKMKKQMKEQLKKQNLDFDEKTFDFEKISEQFGGAGASDFHFDQMQQMMQMQDMQMVEQMNMQMMQQMEQMNLQMMEQMNLQMMEQMNQMNQQMMDQMNQQMMDQMNQQMSMNLDSMNMANQAMTSTDFGGFMDHHAGSGNFGPF